MNLFQNHRYLKGFLFGKIYTPPESSGKSGYIIHMPEGEVFLSEQLIDEATKWASDFKLGFFTPKGLWAMPYKQAEEIRQREFNEFIVHALNR